MGNDTPTAKKPRRKRSPSRSVKETRKAEWSQGNGRPHHDIIVRNGVRRDGSAFRSIEIDVEDFEAITGRFAEISMPANWGDPTRVSFTNRAVKPPAAPGVSKVPGVPTGRVRLWS